MRTRNKEFLFDNIETFFEHDILVSEKILWIGSSSSESAEGDSGVDFDMAERVIKGLLVLDDIDRGKAIRIIMNNPGGDWYHGMAIYDAIKNCKSEVHITVLGSAMSMGSIILQAADKRIVSPNAKIMIHDGQDSVSGHTKTSHTWIKEYESLINDMYDLYSKKFTNVKRANLPKKIKDRFAQVGWSTSSGRGLSKFEISHLCTVDLILNAHEAKCMNLIDEILGEDE